MHLGSFSLIQPAAPLCSLLLAKAAGPCTPICTPPSHHLAGSLALPHPWGPRACWLPSKCQNLLRSFSLLPGKCQHPPSLSGELQIMRQVGGACGSPIFRGSEVTRASRYRSARPKLASWCRFCQKPKTGRPDPARLCVNEGKPAKRSASQRQPGLPQGDLLSRP